MWTGNLIEKLNRHPFFKNVLVLISGNTLGYCVQLLSLPLIGRVYMPQDIGEYDLMLSSGNLVIDLISLGLLIAIMLPAEDKKARQLCQMIVSLNLCFLFILFAVFYGIKEQYQLFDVSMPYTAALLLLCLYMFAFNLQTIFYSYANRHKAYRLLFWNPIIRSLSNAGFSVLLGNLGFGAAGYLIGTIVSYAVCCVHMQIHIRPFREKLDPIRWKELLIEYRNIPLVQLPANMISQAGNEIPTQYLGRIFGDAMLGGYTMAMKILSVPITFFSAPINRVVYQAMAEKKNNNEPVGDFLFELLNKNIKLAIFPVGLLIIFGERLIPSILGASWEASGQYMSILGSMCLLKFCSACISGTFVVMGKQRLSLFMSFVNLAKFGLCFGPAYLKGLGVFKTIQLYAVMECLYQILNLILCVYCTGYSMKKFFIFVCKYIVGANILIYFVYIVLRVYIF